MENSENRALRLPEFFSNPVVGLVGTISSVIGLLLAVYFFVASLRYRELSVLLHPAKAVVVKVGQTSRLNVLLDGKPLKSDVTAAQVAFWNDGTEPIRREHILSPLLILTAKQAPIIDASVRKKSRAVLGVNLDGQNASEGKLAVTWDILEPGDGALVQIIFAGGPDTPLLVGATIEGQKHIVIQRTLDDQSLDLKSISFALFFAGLMGLAGSLGLVSSRSAVRVTPVSRSSLPVNARTLRIFLIIVAFISAASLIAGVLTMAMLKAKMNEAPLSLLG